MKQENIRNIAIIAHVDHGKTTLVDKLLRATDAFRENQKVEERVLDSNDQERERGITILAKNISIEYKGVKINVIDTPGHADFGGEVERVLKMADGTLLLVDAFEGPMPQTRFVLRHAIQAGLSIMIVVNKIDRPGADPEKAYNDCLDLMADLGANDEQLEFAMEHVVYASAMNGFARLDPADDNDNMYPLLDMILDDMPAPEVDPDGPLAMQCVTIDHSEYVGRIGIGRVYSGSIHTGDTILVVKNDGTQSTATVRQLFTFDYLGRKECDVVEAGDIGAVVGIERTDIGDVYTDPENPIALDLDRDATRRRCPSCSSRRRLRSSAAKAISLAPASSKSASCRARNNVTMKIEELEDKSGIEVSGRGILHLSVLMERCAAGASNCQVGRPRVLFKKDENGNKRSSRSEQAVVECPEEYSGKVIEIFGTAGGTMVSLLTRRAWSRTLSSRSRPAASWALRTASSMSPTATACSITRSGIWSLRGRHRRPQEQRDDLHEHRQGGRLCAWHAAGARHAVCRPGDACYEGMIASAGARPGDMVVNVAKTKNLGNQRSSTSDISVQLTPPRTFTLEEALEYITDDELVEITPQNVRMRKRLLSAVDRKKAAKK